MKKGCPSTIMEENSKLEPLDEEFLNWYNSYTYASKITCDAVRKTYAVRST